MNLESVAYHTRHLKSRIEDLEKIIELAKDETDDEIKKMDDVDIKKQCVLIERQMDRLRRFIYK